MIYPARGKKQMSVFNTIAGVGFLGFAGFVIVAALISGHTILGLVMATVLLPSYIWLFFFGMPQREQRHWQYEIQGTDLVVNLPRLRCSVPVSSIEKVVRAQGATRLLWGDVLDVTYVPGTPMMPRLINPEDPDAFLRGLAEADPGLTYRGDRVSRTG